MVTLEKGRIIAGVDSFTYGHGLKDCFSPPYNAGASPSNYSYISLLAKMLNKPLINLSKPGGSNEVMMYYLKSLNINSKDTVVLLWSFFTRTPFYNKDEIINLGEGEGDDSDYIKSLSLLSNNNDLQIKNLTYIVFVTEYLKNIGCNIMYGFLDRFYFNECYPIYKDFFIKNKRLIESYDVFKPFIDSSLEKPKMGGYEYALDKSHPGERWHSDLSKYLYNMYNKELL